MILSMMLVYVNCLGFEKRMSKVLMIPGIIFL